MKPQPLLKEGILTQIASHGGWVDAHGHFDRAYTVTAGTLKMSRQSMEKKWTLVDRLKRESTEEDYFTRIEKCVGACIAQQVKVCATFIDVDSLSELRAMKAAVAVKKKFAGKIELKLINQTLKGLSDPVERKWAEKSLEYVDIIGGLPSRDRPHPGRHLDTLFSWAKETGKMVHVHIDQENNPDERDTELLARKTIENGLEGRVVAVHSISVAAQSSSRRPEIYTLMKQARLCVVCCPSAALSMKQLPVTSELHNSIAPVVELIRAGIPVAIGTDNISDIYQPLVDGDMYTELRILAESSRFYDIATLVDIATENGRIALGI
jgi:cytosine deaminase